MAGEQLPTEQHAATNTGAEGQQHHIAEPLGSAPPGLSHHSAIAVVGEGDPSLQPHLQPLRQRHVLPTRQVDAHPRHPGRGIHRPRQADPHQGSGSIRIQSLDGIAERHRHGARHRRLGGSHLKLSQQGPAVIETGQLDGRSTEINADHLPVIHGLRSGKTAAAGSARCHWNPRIRTRPCWVSPGT